MLGFSMPGLPVPACVQMMMTDTGSSAYWGSERDLDESV